MPKNVQKGVIKLHNAVVNSTDTIVKGRWNSRKEPSDLYGVSTSHTLQVSFKKIKCINEKRKKKKICR